MGSHLLRGFSHQSVRKWQWRVSAGQLPCYVATMNSRIVLLGVLVAFAGGCNDDSGDAEASGSAGETSGATSSTTMSEEATTEGSTSAAEVSSSGGTGSSSTSASTSSTTSAGETTAGATESEGTTETASTGGSDSESDSGETSTEASGGDGSSAASAASESSGGPLYNCDDGDVLCLAAPPDCQTGYVPSVVDMCWGDCVEASLCGRDPR